MEILVAVVEEVAWRTAVGVLERSFGLMMEEVVRRMRRMCLWLV